MSTAVKARVDLYYSGAYNDITSYVYSRDPIQIRRGTPNESATADPSQIQLTLNNRDGRFSRNNPTSPLYGLIGRNTPIRVRAGLTLPDNQGLCLPQETNSDYASTPDAAALDITGDIDIAVEFTAFTVVTSTQCLIGKGVYTGSGTQLSYQLLIGVTAGVPHVTLRWSTDGTTQHFVDHPMTALSNYKHMAIRATLDVDNGASGNTASFYTSSDGTINGSWTLDGSTTVTAGTTSIYSGSGAAAVGCQPDGATNTFRGIIHAAYVKNGIGGTAVANPNFNAQTHGATSFTDAAGRTWTLQGTSYLDYYLHTRMVAEISSLPYQRDTSGHDMNVPITASGVLRRIQQGQNIPKTDPMAAYLQTSSPVVAFVGSTPSDVAQRKTLDSIASNATFGAGTLNLGSKVIQLGVGAPTRDANGYMRSGYLNADISQSALPLSLGFIWQADLQQMGNLGVVATSYDDGTVSREWELQCFGQTGLINLVLREFDRSTLATTVTTLLSVAHESVSAPNANTNYGDGAQHTAYLMLAQSGSNVTWNVYIDGVSIGSGTKNSINLATLWQLHVGYDSGIGGPCNFGYLTAYPANVPTAAIFNQVATGYAGETAVARLIRLAALIGVPITVTGTPSASMLMGAQTANGILNLMQEAATSDAGYFGDSRYNIGLAYQVRTNLYNQTPQATLDWSTHIFNGDPAPIDDDYSIHNDVTASNASGATAEEVLTTGPLSTQSPPNGINAYPTQLSVNVQSNAFLNSIARWALNKSTIDKPRWPTLPVTMLNQHLTTQLYNQLADLALTNLIQVTNLPAPAFPPDPVNLMIIGDTESIQQDKWDVTWNAISGDPYTVGIWGSFHYDAENSTVHTGGFTSTATTASIDSAANTELWTTDVAAFPFDIMVGGEQITVSGISGSSSPQTFTFSARSVNGVVKAHVANEPVHLAPAYQGRYAL